LVVASSTPSELSASLAARLADRLGAGGTPLDLRAGGAGGLLALVSAAALLHGGGRRALVVAAEATSLYLPSEPLSTALLYGDGAAALALERRPGESGGLLRAASARVAPAGQSFTVAPAAHGPGASGLRFRAPDRAYGARLGRAADELAERLRREPPPQHFLPAVAGDLPLARLHSLTGLPMDRTHTVHRSHGVLGAAAPLLAWVRLHRSGAVRPGDELLLAAVGGGIQWALVRWRLAAGDELEVVR
jgi:3-oxoacyl-[acyl-carrier-protein] synthase-3